MFLSLVYKLHSIAKWHAICDVLFVYFLPINDTEHVTSVVYINKLVWAINC